MGAGAKGPEQATPLRAKSKETSIANAMFLPMSATLLGPLHGVIR